MALYAKDAAFFRRIRFGGRSRSSSGSLLSVSHVNVFLELKHVEELVVARGAPDQQDAVIGVEVDVEIALSHELFGAHLTAKHLRSVLGVEVVLSKGRNHRS